MKSNNTLSVDMRQRIRNSIENQMLDWGDENYDKDLDVVASDINDLFTEALHQNNSDLKEKTRKKKR